MGPARLPGSCSTTSTCSRYVSSCVRAVPDEVGVAMHLDEAGSLWGQCGPALCAHIACLTVTDNEAGHPDTPEWVHSVHEVVIHWECGACDRVIKR